MFKQKINRKKERKKERENIIQDEINKQMRVYKK